ncbi:MAG: TIGR03086 family metal-binding protein [Nocardioidaceae bacterium]
MDRLHTLEYALRELRHVVGTLDDSVMDAPTNCEPWSVRRLASHALNNQLLWAGLVTGQHIVSVEDAMGAVPIDGDLDPVAAEVTAGGMALWRTDGILDAVHATPFGDLPGSAVIDFAIIDAAAHAWDLSASLGRPIELDPEQIAAIADVVAATCNDVAIAHGLIKPATEPPADATETERLMSLSGRNVAR